MTNPARNFRLNVILRVLILAGGGLLFDVLLFHTPFITPTLLLGILLLALTLELIFYVEKSNREVTNFLQAIRQNDFSTTYTLSGTNPSHDALKHTFNEITEAFQRLRKEMEAQHQYLQTVVDHIGVALLSYNDRGEIELMNQAAIQLFGKPYLYSVHALAHLDPVLHETVIRMQHRDRELVKFRQGDQLLRLSVQVTEFKLQGWDYKLVSFQNIQAELDNHELDAWQKLIRVLTHEIMNSVTPIYSLSGVILQMLQPEEADSSPLAPLDEEDQADLLQSLRTIESRSRGLIHFVKAYRSLTQISPPDFREVQTVDLFERIATLLGPEMEKRGITFLPTQMTGTDQLLCDPELIEQILINLIINAMDAVEGHREPNIQLTARRDETGRIRIEVEDNGCGIDAETLPNIFVPFYTTKKSGSGIGLSLSRQLMRLHRGSIQVKTWEGKGTRFTLVF